MSVFLKRKGDKNRYWFLNEKCIGCTCFAPGVYYSRGATMSGSRNTGDSSPRCMRNAYHACPDEVDREFSERTVVERRKEGWKRA